MTAISRNNQSQDVEIRVVLSTTPGGGLVRYRAEQIFGTTQMAGGT
jgi:hypothetical protein